MEQETYLDTDDVSISVSVKSRSRKTCKSVRQIVKQLATHLWSGRIMTFEDVEIVSECFKNGIRDKIYDMNTRKRNISIDECFSMFYSPFIVYTNDTTNVKISPEKMIALENVISYVESSMYIQNGIIDKEEELDSNFLSLSEKMCSEMLHNSKEFKIMFSSYVAKIYEFNHLVLHIIKNLMFIFDIVKDDHKVFRALLSTFQNNRIDLGDKIPQIPDTYVVYSILSTQYIYENWL
jgi:hypothetical protein